MYHIYISTPYHLPITSLSEVSHMYALCIPNVSLMYLYGCLFTQNGKYCNNGSFGNNGKKQQSQSAFFGRRYCRVIFLSGHLFMLNRGNKTIILNLKNQKKMAKFVNVFCHCFNASALPGSFVNHINCILQAKY